MTKFGFAKRQDAQELLDLIRPPIRFPSSRVRREPVLTTGWLFVTPPGGIPASTGQGPGMADCVPLLINDNDEYEELTDNNGDPITVQVYNVFSSAVAGNTRITAKEIYKKLAVDAEDCG